MVFLRYNIQAQLNKTIVYRQLSHDIIGTVIYTLTRKERKDV